MIQFKNTAVIERNLSLFFETHGTLRFLLFRKFYVFIHNLLKLHPDLNYL